MKNKNNTIKTLSASEVGLLTRLEFEGKEIYTRGEITSFCEDRRKTAYLIKKLLEKDRLKRIIRNIYFFIPMKAPDGLWSPNEYLIAKALARGANYYIGYITSFNSYGFTDQLAQQIYVLNDKYSGKKTVLGVTYKLIKVIPAKLYGLEKRKINGEDVVFPQKERAIIDVFEFYDTEQAHKILSQQIKKLDLTALVKYLAQYPILKIRRRIGYFLETLGANRGLLSKIEIEESSYTPLHDNHPVKGKINKAWRLIING